MPMEGLKMSVFPLACAERLKIMGLLIKNRRLERKIRQIDLARQTGLSTSTLGKIEAGAPSVEMRCYMTVLWHLGLLDEAFQNIPVPSLASYATEHRVRLKRFSEEDF
ncbi:helix-turn-helix domain-containing protein [Pseudomonas sp. NPDC089554]|uniref:helix-turn-helix domain-containing protein n=1 Tax=Pseudomonas sp. NPDC089554 TaxID=3390653 RepID=UPI003CFEE1A0